MAERFTNILAFFRSRISLLLHVDFGSLKFRLWGYFGLFAVILVLMLWILQVFFLNYYYEDMKLRETQRIVSDIQTRFKADVPLSEIRSYITQIYRESGIYIQIELEQGAPIAIPNVFYGSTETDASGNAIEELPSSQPPRSFYPTVYRNEIDNLKTQLTESGENNFSKHTIEPETNQQTLEYAVFIDRPLPAAEPGAITAPGLLPDSILSATMNQPGSGRLVLCLFSPLYPQQSTSQILNTQLTYVTIIAVLISILLAFYLARMITKPLSEITARAEELAAGNFGIDFPAARYSEIIRLADTLSHTSRELALTRTMQRDIIANVSHDLKTPLTMIRSYAEMIRDLSGDDPAKRDTHLQIIIQETERLNAMIAELLSISRLQSGEMSIKRTDFSLKELIDTTIAAYSSYVEKDGYKLIFVSRGEGIVRADETLIKQVLDNLVSNAVKYGGKDKSVEIRMTEANGLVRVEVTDHGIGISKRDIRHVWERYYKSSAHHSRTDSTGLGLSIVKEILVLHNAKYGAESVYRQGSTFWFELRTATAYETWEEDGGALDGSET
jgi:signal transduction histidine kinase